MEISESEYNELVSARDWKAAHEQELKDLQDFKKEHEEPDTDEQVRAYLGAQRKKEVARQERVKKLQSTFM